MRIPEPTSSAEVDHLIEECTTQGIPIYYSSQTNIATPYLLENLLKRVARLEKELKLDNRP